jgi:hypothetical protein
MNNDDYGYFGKGTEGYIHYKQAFDESFKNNTPSTGRKAPQSKVSTPRTKEVQDADWRFFCGVLKVCGVFCGSAIFVCLVWFVAAVAQSM